MKHGTKYWRGSLVVVGLVVALLGSTIVFADGTTPGVLAPNATLGGLKYGDWSVKWWQWAFSVTTFDDCTLNQSGQMWFLAGTKGGSATRSCTVPAGKNIMFPIFNVEQSVVEANLANQRTKGETTCTVGTTPILDANGNFITGTDYSALSTCAQSIARHALLTAQGASLEADVDGQQVTNLPNYEAASPSPLFTFTTVKGNPFGLCPGPLGPCPLTSSTAADGFWIILGPQPLPAGSHKIHFKAVVPFLEIPFTFTTEVTYNLTVQQ